MSFKLQNQTTSKLALIKSLFKSNQAFNDDARRSFPILTTSSKANPKKLHDFNKLVEWKNIKVLPPTWLQAAAMPLYMQLITVKNFPFSPLGLVHVENRVRLLQPLPIDALYDISCYADNFRTHRKGQLFDLVVKATLSNELVYESVASNLAFLKQESFSEAPNPSNLPEEVDLTKEMAHFHCASDVGRKYASVSGDYNLIHLAAFPAKLFGFKRHIAHGMYLKARALSTLQANGSLADEHVEVGIRFMKPVFLPGEIVMFSGMESGNLAFSLESTIGNIIHCKGQVRSLKGR